MINLEKYSSLNPKLIAFCRNLLENSPEKEEEILKVMDSILEESKDEYFSNPPHNWNVENWEKDHVLYHNGVFFMEVRQEDGKAVVSLDSNFPIKKETKSFGNIFEAIFIASQWQGDLNK